MTRGADHTVAPFNLVVMCNNGYLQEWQAECIRQLQLLDHVQFPLIVNNPPDSGETQSKSSFKEFSYRGLMRAANCRARKGVPIEKLLPETTMVDMIPDKKGKFSEHFKNEDLERIRAVEPHAILRFGFGILKGEVLECCPYGVWSFHHSDEQQYRGGPSGFWELYNGDVSQGAILQRLTDRIDGGIVLKKGRFKVTRHSMQETIDSVFYSSAQWPKQVVIDIANGEASYFEAPPSNSNAPMNKLPGVGQQMRLVFNLIIQKLRFHIDSLMRTETWAIGLIRQDVRDFCFGDQSLPPQWWQPYGTRGYAADPFLYHHQERLHLIFEHFEHRAGTAKLAYTLVKESSLEPSSETTSLPWVPGHASFPSIFTHEQNTYCIPETTTSDKTVCYVLQEDGKWTHHTDILPDVGLIDPVVIDRNGKWWLFGTMKGTSNEALYIYYADQLEGPYVPHSNNPVKWDIHSARPAGSFFRHQGHLYRPVQDSGSTYGSQIHLYRVDELSATVYKESHVNTLKPDPGWKFNKGLHTLSHVNGVTAIDVKNYVFSWDGFLKQLSAKWRNLFAANTGRS